MVLVIGKVAFLNFITKKLIFITKMIKGCFCNPAACQRYLHLTDDDLYNRFVVFYFLKFFTFYFTSLFCNFNNKAGRTCGDDNDLLNGRPTGALRVSFGYMSRKRDADTLVNVLRMTYLSV